MRAEDALREIGLSPALLEGFFRPFLAGVTLDPALGVSSRFTDFVLRMFAGGRVSVPATGMGALPAQFAAGLDVRLGAEVAGVDGEGVRLRDGGRVAAAAVVVACEGSAAARLVPGLPDRGSVSVTCVYFDAPASPIGEGVLVLDGEDAGPVNNLAVMSDVAPGYAPAGRALVSASVLGEPDPTTSASSAELARSCGAGSGCRSTAGGTCARTASTTPSPPSRPARSTRPSAPCAARRACGCAATTGRTPPSTGCLARGAAPPRRSRWPCARARGAQAKLAMTPARRRPPGSGPAGPLRERAAARAVLRSRGRGAGRAGARPEHEWPLLPLRVRGLERVRLHADLTILAKLAGALSRARTVPLAAGAA